MNKEQIDKLVELTPIESIDGLLSYVGKIDALIDMENCHYILNVISAALGGIKNKMDNEKMETWATLQESHNQWREERMRTKRLEENIGSFKSALRLLLNGLSVTRENEDEKEDE